MSFRKSPRAIRLLLLVALVLLSAFPVHASPNGIAGHRGDGSTFTAFVDELRALWTGFWGDSGCTIDPDGRMRSAQGREGMSIDPNGGTNGGAPTPGAGTDEGTSIDPHG
jgi:hypothetical protein